MTYDLRRSTTAGMEAGTVEYVFRDGDVLYARMTTGEEFAVTDQNSHVLVPLRACSPHAADNARRLKRAGVCS